jgi:predicted DNA-binding transcriptional regulator YafY
MATTKIISAAMQCPDDLVVCLEYVDSKGVRTRRVVSPIRYVGRQEFLGLCLSRCEPRRFKLERCSAIKLARASDFVMPVEMQVAS